MIKYRVTIYKISALQKFVEKFTLKLVVLIKVVPFVDFMSWVSYKYLIKSMQNN